MILVPLLEEEIIHTYVLIDMSIEENFGSLGKIGPELRGNWSRMAK